MAELERMRAQSNGEDRKQDGEGEEEDKEGGEEDEDSWEGFSDEEEVKDDAPAASKANGHVLKQNDIEDINTAEEQHESAKPSKKEKKKKETKDKKEKSDTKTISEEEEQPSDDEAADEEVNGIGAFDILANRLPEDDEEDEVDISAWEELGLSQQTLDAVASLKFSQPTPIQASTIPEILAGRDVIGKASTGSGKTLAFGIPILESFLRSLPASKKITPLALIISPTRELAHQISAHLTALCSGGDFDAPFIATVTGGLAVQKQRRQLEKANIVIGTPGRLWEVISSGQGLLDSFKRVQFLVIDEADRLLSEGHYKEFGEILNIFEADQENADSTADTDAPKTVRQTLIFSATFQKGLQQKLTGGKRSKGGDLMNKEESMEYLLKKIQFREEKPRFIDANPASQMATGLREGLVECAGTEKDLYLYSLLLYHPKKRALIFTNSVSAVRRLTPYLQNLNLPALPLHSGMAQKARLRSIERFTQRPGSILVATDVAARGLDIPGVELIIHYHLPRAADTYVHRSGRTARGDASGTSILICGPEEVAGVRRLVAKVHARAADQPSKSKSKKTAFFIRTLDIDRRIVSKLKPRATLSKKLADATIAKEKKHSEDDWMRAAAEELGVDYDSETFEKEAKGKHGRGSGRKLKEKQARETSKAELQAMRAELKSLLAQRVNVGVSERYLTSGRLDVEALMKGEGNLEFLGDAGDFGFED
ncbi:DEAD-domain-containing protein [Periconia macrospinosa]|uniref:ATP-dependent RNA helicase n=1 Tax=Periconia macrospinosa TaxID=97972 RepID=A0A2V1E066_9PLEO|nr:DEAD-domain-containing protein [Periconia macrospinosa]